MTAPRPIFLHGAIAGPSSWGALAERFDGGAVLGLPGHPTGVPITDAPQLAEWIATAILQVQSPRVLVGQGLGAQLALLIARDHPDRVDGVVALGCAPRLRVPAIGDNDLDRAIRTVLDHSMSEPDGGLRQSLEFAMQLVGSSALDADLAMTQSIDVGAIAGDVTCPVLVIVGERDLWAAPQDATGLATALANSYMVVINGAGHLVQADAPATTQLLIAAFLARLELTLTDA